MHPHTNSDTQAHSPATKSTVLGERLAFAPGEFAAFFGKSKTWGYRAIYAGKVQVLDNSDRLMIPRSEVEKFLSRTTIYNGRPARSPQLKKSSRFISTSQPAETETERNIGEEVPA